ncbi:NADP-dependent 3-hydroxy acid dehydrogenase YdfG [Umezawaea tangerina]|uniref:NADP-dependent 3-hydroxy acid dehydrogenase YdfG n=1 Tax=Umezawaea tangerina TaxID=84725 RepID=A0A2T0SBW7_9PSEU|nr:NADP-dependent 3-hydroxy acid dehydrogenase YdfG [Umezawaea tangerina]
MEDRRFEGKVALITGAANGIGAGASRRLAESGAHVVVADIDGDRGKVIADEVDGLFVHCDVRDPEHSKAAVAAAVERFGKLDLVALNAGISTGFTLGEDFDPERYRSVMGINLDGVVYGVHAALPALRETGGQIIATASMAGITPTPMDPIYGANKTAVVGLVRSLAPSLQKTGVRVNALCPSFADTAIIGPFRAQLESTNMPIMEVADVVKAFMAIAESDGTGECWFVVPGRESQPFTFRNAPGPRTATGERMSVDPGAFATGQEA